MIVVRWAARVDLDTPEEMDDTQKQAELTRGPFTDSEGVPGYRAWVNGKRVTTITDPSHTELPFKRLKPPVTQYTFAVAAFDAAGNESQPSVPARIGS